MREIYWSRFPQDYDTRQALVARDDLLEAIADALNELPELGDVAELGCGTGFFTKLLVGKASSIVATDLSEELLTVAATRLAGRSKVRFEKQDCTATTFDSEAFDSVVAVNVLHVIESPAVAIKECYRLLKAGGLLVVVSFTNEGMTAWEKVKMGVRFLRAWGKPPEHTHALSPESLQGLFEGANFQIEHVRLIGGRTKAVCGTARKPAGDQAAPLSGGEDSQGGTPPCSEDGRSGGD